LKGVKILNNYQHIKFTFQNKEYQFKTSLIGKIQIKNLMMAVAAAIKSNLKIDDIVIANDNSSSQVVLSGSQEALDNLSREISCKRFLKLNVSGAFHSPLMDEPAVKFSEYLKKIKFKNPSFPVISNYYPSLCDDPAELKIRLENQMCNGVRWRETMDLMAKIMIFILLKLAHQMCLAV